MLASWPTHTTTAPTTFLCSCRAGNASPSSRQTRPSTSTHASTQLVLPYLNHVTWVGLFIVTIMWSAAMSCDLVTYMLWVDCNFSTIDAIFYTRNINGLELELAWTNSLLIPSQPTSFHYSDLDLEMGSTVWYLVQFKAFCDVALWPSSYSLSSHEPGLTI